jgi:hypothetical protein
LLPMLWRSVWMATRRTRICGIWSRWDRLAHTDSLKPPITLPAASDSALRVLNWCASGCRMSSRRFKIMQPWICSANWTVPSLSHFVFKDFCLPWASLDFYCFSSISAAFARLKSSVTCLKLLLVYRCWIPIVLKCRARSTCSCMRNRRPRHVNETAVVCR